MSDSKIRITVKESAKILGLSPGRIRNMISDGLIKDVKKYGRDNRISLDEIEKLKDLPRSIGRPKKSK